jgi:cell division protein FtsQ
MARVKEDILLEEKLAAAVRSRSRHFIRLGPGGIPKSRSNRARWERRRKICQAVFTVLATGAAVGGVVLLQRAVLANEEFVVRGVECRTDGVLTEAEILKAAGPLEGRHILQVNIDAVGSALRQQPLVEQATVERRFPASVSISLRERRPAVWLIDHARGAESRDAGGFLLDHEGVAMRCDVLRAEYTRFPAIETGPPFPGQDDEDDRAKESTPLVSGEQIADAGILAAIELHGILKQLCEKHSIQVERYLVDRHYCLDVEFAGGLKARFAVEFDREERRQRFAEQAALLEETLRHCSAAGRNPVAIDLTLAGAVAVKHSIPRAQVVQDEALPRASSEILPDEDFNEFIPEEDPEFSEQIVPQP